MPFTKEVSDVLPFVENLPEKYQKRAAFWLRRIVLEHEEDTTMTQMQREKLRKLRDKKTRDMAASLIGPGGSMVKALSAVANRKRKK